MKKILFISLITILLLFVACKKEDGKEPPKSSASKILDCREDFNCFKDALLKGDKAKVLASDVDDQTSSVMRLLLESRGRSNNYTITSQKVELIKVSLSEEEKKLFNPEQKACYQVVEKEFGKFIKGFEGKEMECKIDSSKLADVTNEESLIELFNEALRQSIEEPDVDMSNFDSDDIENLFLNFRVNLKPDSLCKGKLAEEMINMLSAIFKAGKSAGESSECAPILARGEPLPGMFSLMGSTGP